MSKRFPHVKWYCDKCDAFLNRQKGFDDHLDCWECTKCGYENTISSDQVFESKDEYQKTRLAYKCGHCDVALNDQRDFDATLQVWLCEECGYVNNLIDTNPKTVNGDTIQNQTKTAWEKAKPILKKVGKGALVVGGFVAAVTVAVALSKNKNRESIQTNNDDYVHAGSLRKRTTPPKIPAKYWSRIYDRDGVDEANRILEKVERGELSVEQIERAMNRGEIPPERWRDFEDGTWEPDGWFD